MRSIGFPLHLRQPAELYNIWRKRSLPSLKQKTWCGLVPADANWSHLLVVATDQKGNAKLQTKVFTLLVAGKKNYESTRKRKIFSKYNWYMYYTHAKIKYCKDKSCISHKTQKVINGLCNSTMFWTCW